MLEDIMRSCEAVSGTKLLKALNLVQQNSSATQNRQHAEFYCPQSHRVERHFRGFLIEICFYLRLDSNIESKSFNNTYLNNFLNLLIVQFSKNALYLKFNLLNVIYRWVEFYGVLSMKIANFNPLLVNNVIQAFLLSTQ